MVNQRAACLYQQEANVIQCTARCRARHAHNARSDRVAKTHQDTTDRQRSYRQHQGLAQLLQFFHHKSFPS